MSETRNRRKEKRRNIAGEAGVAVILAMVCVVLGAGIGEFYVRDMLTSDISVSVSKNFESNAESYADSYSSSELDNIEAGSGAYAGADTADPEDSSETVMPDEDFIFPRSSEEQLTDADLAKLTDAASCQRAINEILARHGCEFYAQVNGEDYNYFNSKAWYLKMTKKLSTDCLAELSSVENTNIALISNYQALMGWYGGYL